MSKTKYAHDCGKTVLYKFRPYTEGQYREWVRQIVEEHRIYFSRRSQLNDPFDLSPVIFLDIGSDEAAFRERLVADAKRSWARNEPHLPPEEIERRCLWFRTRDLGQFESDARATAVQRFENDYWVFSLAGNRSHPMLWSHYADGHKGLCLHFTADSIFGASQRVEYVTDRPRIAFPFVLDSKQIAELALLRKGKFWSYEEEFRFIRYPNTDFSDVALHFSDQHATFEDHLLIGTTVGARMPAADIETVLKMAARHAPPLPVWRAREKLTYEFEFEQLAGT